MDKKQFRISAKKIFLTYSQVDENLTNEQILQQLENKPSLAGFRYVIGRELHENQGTHYHIVLTRDKKFEIKNSSILNIQHENKTFHGNYKTVKDFDTSVSYACKDGNYITNFKNIREGKLLTPKQFLLQEAREKGIQQALLQHLHDSPNKAIGSLAITSAKRDLDEIKRIELMEELDTINTPFSLENFNTSGKLTQWMENPNKTLILVGDSGIGKTQFCKTYAQEKGLKTLMVTNKQDLRRLNLADYDAIIIDDANLHEFEETQLLSLVDNQENKTMRVLYNNVSKKAGIIQMIAMNKPEFIKIFDKLTQKRFARRVLIEQLQNPFMVNINVQINNHISIDKYINNSTTKQEHANNSIGSDTNVTDIIDKKIQFQLHQENEQKLIQHNQNVMREIRDNRSA